MPSSRRSRCITSTTRVAEVSVRATPSTSAFGGSQVFHRSWRGCAARRPRNRADVRLSSDGTEDNAWLRGRQRDREKGKRRLRPSARPVASGPWSAAAW
ncbi:hypothetical protein GA0115255_110886 [Streptomyces sp. Ncost-T6T-2b]|nr:hypothetical protein GA0115255_110886 [Streptomyces sp. Ncost-T6T-2b]